MPPPATKGGGDLGGGGGEEKVPSYADRLRTNVKFNQLLKRKVLDIALDKDDSVNANIDPGAIHKQLTRLGINVASQVEGYQLFPGRPFHMEVWMIPGVNLDQFCKEDVFQVNDKVKTSYIRPAGRREVTVSIKGLNFNTPDSHVIEYLNKHGVVASNSVVYGKFADGPFKGKFNGIRKYLVDFTKGNKLNMGNFHIINGARVTDRYPGQK